MDATLNAPIAVISPHLDDAVFGCGDRLAACPGSTVITVFAGGPGPSWQPVTPWDAASGFRSGDDVAAVRRHEDERALEILQARPVWLDFWDAQYGRHESVGRIRDALALQLDDVRPASVYFPVGLFHSDHRLVHEACRALCQRFSASWFLYEDAIYRRYRDFPTDAILAELTASGFGWEPIAARIPDATPAKRGAVACYASQLKALSSTPGHPGYGDVFFPERAYRLRPPLLDGTFRGALVRSETAR